jgi:hypothetical protein
MFANGFGQRVAADAGHLEVGEDCLGWEFAWVGELLESVCAGVGGFYGVAASDEKVLKEFPADGIVVDD